MLYSLRDFRHLNDWLRSLIPVVRWEIWADRKKVEFFIVHIIEIYAKATTVCAVVSLFILGGMRRVGLLGLDELICVSFDFLLMMMAMASAISRRLWNAGREERFRILMKAG